MRVKAFRYIGDKHPLFAEDLQVVLVELDDGTPAMVGCQCEPHGGFNALTVAHANEEDFNTILRNLGFTRMTVCQSLGDMSRPVHDLERLPVVVPRR